MYTRRFWFVTGMFEPFGFSSRVIVRGFDPGIGTVSVTVKFKAKSSTSPG
jgi:hypothetical protein